MTNNNTLSPDLQEIMDKVFPPYTGDLIDGVNTMFTYIDRQNVNEAIAFCENFDENKPDWQRLDWALTIPGIKEKFPELNEKLRDYLYNQKLGGV